MKARGRQCAGLALLAMSLAAVAASAQLRFVDTASEAGLAIRTWCGSQAKPHILESGGTGVALFDYDGDHDLDLYVVNGWRLEGSKVAERGRNALYRNRGDGTFDDVTEHAGVGDDGWGTGVAVGDADGDGRPDLLVTNFGPDVLYRNQGDGTFRVVEGAPSIDGWSTGAVLFDADGDGDEDVFVAGYIDCSLDQVLAAKPTLAWYGQWVMAGPFGLEGFGDRYFENLGGLEFREGTAAAGLEDVGLFYTFAVAAVDLDGDRDLDLYTANDSNPNYLYQNDGSGHFREVGLWSGAALDAAGKAQAGMGIAAEDLDGDGLVDLLVTNFFRDVSTFYRNQGEMMFVDDTRTVGLEEPTFLPLSWGATFSDFNLDGDLDLFIANGHIYPQADQAAEANTSYRQRNLLLRKDGARFVDVSAAGGPGLEVEESSRGLAAGDVDSDGDLDLVITNCDAPPTLLRNDSERAGSWLLVDAPGALRAEVRVGQRRLVRHRAIGGSYLSVSDRRFHFGLGAATQIDQLRLVWPDGSESLLAGLGVNHVVTWTPSTR